MSDAKLLSIVVPVYFNELNLPETVPALLSLADQIQPMALELVFVDDGSRDRSLEVLLQFQQQHPETIRVVKLTRNFGSMAAIQAGLKVARGDCVGMISADLQDPHDLFVEMVGRWREGVKAVLAVRQDREETAGQRWFANTYYRLLRRFAVPDYPKGGFDFCLIDRQLVEEINRMAEKNTHIMTLIFWLGFSPALIPYTRRKRRLGKSRWTLQKKLKLFVDSFIAFSYVPIRFLSVVGLLTSFLAVLYAGFQVAAKLIYGTPVPGFSTTVVLIALTSGVQMIMLGVLGEYLWRILDETRGRPMYVVDRIYTGSGRPPVSS